MRLTVNDKFNRGDTIAEVLFAIAVFSFIMIAILQIMQQGTIATQTALEINLARNQMNSQAEAIRFINSASQSRERKGEAGDTSIYTGLWNYLKENKQKTSVYDWSSIVKLDSKDRRMHCVKMSEIDRAFVIDVKNLNPRTAVSNNAGGAESEINQMLNNAIQSDNKITEAVTYPRLVHVNTSDDNNKISQANSEFLRSEGLWVEMVESSRNNTSIAYDFHIRACWEISGVSSPITLGTIIRVYEARGEW